MPLPRKALADRSAAPALMRAMPCRLACSSIVLVALVLSILFPSHDASSSSLADCAHLVGRYNLQHNASLRIASVCVQTVHSLPDDLPSEARPFRTTAASARPFSSCTSQQLSSCSLPTCKALPSNDIATDYSHLPRLLILLFNTLPIHRDRNDNCAFPTQDCTGSPAQHRPFWHSLTRANGTMSQRAQSSLSCSLSYNNIINTHTHTHTHTS